MSGKWARRSDWAALLPLIFMVTACGSPSSEPTATPSASPVITPYATRTAEPTERPEVAPTSETPEATPTPQTYIIAAGDTFLGIAERFGITLEALLAANQGVNTSFLSVGAEINLPTVVDGEVVTGLPTPTALPLPLAEPSCYASAAGELWCFALVENNGAELVDIVLGQVELLGVGGALVERAEAITLLNGLPPGAAMPLVAYWPEVPQGWVSARAVLSSAFAVSDPEGRYLETQLSGESVEMGESGLSARITGEAAMQGGGEFTILWVLAVAYDAEDNVVGVRRWESEEAAPNFDFYVYSLAGPIERVELFGEALP